jgi:hypothetical protein
MSFDIQGVGPQQSAAPVSAGSGDGSPLPSTSGIEAEDEAVQVQTMPLSPPREVMDAIYAAADAYDQLEASGRRLQFGTDPSTGRVSAELQDLDGNRLASLTPTEVLAIADGQTPA